MAVLEGAAPVAAPRERVRGYSWFVLFVLGITYTLNFLDRQLVGTLGVQIQDGLGIDAAQLGKVTGAYFAIFYCTISVFVGILADRTHRVRIVAAGAFLFSFFTILCGQSRVYWHLVVARMGVGFGEAGGAPPCYSLVSDYFPQSKRSEALGLFSLGVPFGAALGIYGGAKLTQLWDWRMPFLVVGIAGIVCALLVLILVREPKRGATDKTAYADDPPTFVDVVKVYFSSPVLVMVGLASGMGALVALGLNLGAPQIMQREKGMSLDEYAVWYALMFGISQGLGTWAAGWLADKFGAKHMSGYAYVPAIGLALAIPFYLAFLYAPTWRLALAFLAVPTFFNTFYLAPAIAVVINSVSPRRRTTSSALLLFLLNGLGFGFGPTLVGAWAKHYQTLHDPHPWQSALFWLTPLAVVAVILHLVLARFLRLREASHAAPIG
jgi:MFS family permease